MRRTSVSLALLWVLVTTAGASPPIFENGTPVGFAPQDSTTRQDFVSGERISVRVDLNQAATAAYPVVAEFQRTERSVTMSSGATDGMQVDIAMVDVVPFGTNSDQAAAGDTTGADYPVLHMAWIEQTTSAPRAALPYTGGSTPVYRVMYARSFDGGASFSSAVDVANGTTFHPLTMNGSGASFSTLDLEVDSGGNPRVVFAFVSTADRSRSRNVYLAYSNDGGGSWSPNAASGESLLILNDAATVGADVNGRRNCAFPRLAIDDRDDLYVSYVRGATKGTGGDDIMLTKINRYTTPFSAAAVGESGTAGTGGIRLAPDGDRQTGPDLTVGDGDALHVIYFNDTDNRIEHKRLSTDTTWVDVSASGWDQNTDGAAVGTFVDEGDVAGAVETEAHCFFPTVVVDRQRFPDRVYALYKYGGDNTDPVEGIRCNHYDDNGATGASASWGTAAAVWSDQISPLFSDGASYNIELDWEISERVSAVVDDRQEDRGDLHIAFTAGFSGSGEHDIYYARYNGVSWSLPDKVADDDSDGSGTQDGIDNADVFLQCPVLAQHPDSQNLFLAFVGGTAEGFGVDQVTDVDQHAYFKVLGRDLSWEDESVPTGAYEYTLSYTPVHPHSTASEVADCVVLVHAADPADGTGLGAAATSSDGFLAGDWEGVGTTLADRDKQYEGRSDEAAGSHDEWGDDGDKVGLLLKLNVLGSDSATNLQVVTASSAAARTVSVGSDPSGSFVGVSSYFTLGADIDIVPASTAPVVSVAQPDGTDDSANTQYTIQYSATDADDALGGDLRLALYAYASDGLRTVQDIRIFATLIADENDVSSVNADGTDDLTQGANQTYTWDDPPAALKSSGLFASILRVPSGTYYIYVVADDGKNAPVFAVSSGPLQIIHSPIVQQIDPILADTVDTGMRTGIKANPYDLDFRVVDYDSEAHVQLFYAAVAGITSVSVSGVYPAQSFALGKSHSGTRGTAITSTTSLSSRDTEYSWDVSSPLIPQGSYYLYAVATDSAHVTVANSTKALAVQHSPSFVFYEPARDTQRQIDSGSQPVYTIQWQKGPGDGDLDDDASIALYFTTDDPATADHSTASGASSTSLTSDADTHLIVSGLSEDGDGAADIYIWDLRDPPNDVPVDGTRVWIYAVITDGVNTTVARGGALTVTHTPYVLLETRMPTISQGDIVRLEWDDYLVDDGSGTDDAYLRLYASTQTDLGSLQELEASVGAGQAYIINSSDGTAGGNVTSLRESSSTSYSWDTWSQDWMLPTGSYTIYAGISADATFADNTRGRVSAAPNALVVGVGSGTTPHLSLSPSSVQAAVGDTLTFEIWVQSAGQAAETVSVTIDLSATHLLVQDSLTPFTDLGEVFVGGTVIDNSTSSNVVRFVKTKSGGEVIGSTDHQLRLASFRAKVESDASGTVPLAFAEEETALSLAGSATPLKINSGLSVQNARFQAVSRGRILATVLLEGRAAPLGDGDHSTLLDVHLRRPGSTEDVLETWFRVANDDAGGTLDTIEVQTSSAGELVLESVPAGRYVLTVKDTSHLSGRTDTLEVRNGESITLASSQGFFASDIRGDASFLLDQSGRQLKAGDVTGDNEIDEDDVNAVDGAWGTDTSATYFAAADLNNDLRVGVEDLTVTSSNISNSTGFGAPPVFKRAVGSRPLVTTDNDSAAVQVLAPGHVGAWCRGDELELVVQARRLGDLAGFALQLDYDPSEMSILTGGLRTAAVLRAGPQGATVRLRQRPGLLELAAARRGCGWVATGEGELLRMRVRLERDGFPASLQLRNGKLLSSRYATTPFQLVSELRNALLPAEFVLGPNYPNPFNPHTTIPLVVPGVGNSLVPVSAVIHNVLGQRVATLWEGRMRPGHHRLEWSGRDDQQRPAASGVYLCRVRVGDTERVRPLTLVR